MDRPHDDDGDDEDWLKCVDGARPCSKIGAAIEVWRGSVLFSSVQFSSASQVPGEQQQLGDRLGLCFVARVLQVSVRYRCRDRWQARLSACGLPRENQGQMPGLAKLVWRWGKG